MRVEQLARIAHFAKETLHHFGGSNYSNQRGKSQNHAYLAHYKQ